MSDKQRRLNTYTCPCGKFFLSEDKDDGVTPFMMPCGCGGDAYSAFYAVDEIAQALPADVEWFKPTAAETKKLVDSMRTHTANGGLVFRAVSLRPSMSYLEKEAARQWRGGKT